MFLRIFLLVLFSVVSCASASTPALDVLVLGEPASEPAHQLDARQSEIFKSALDQPARRLLPGGEQPWEGGRIAFTMKVDPDRPTYLTARFWGGEANPNNLVLFCEGKQVGYRHLGDIDVLSLADDEPRYPGRFYYATTPLPRVMTKGKTQVRLEIRSSGPVWGYAKSFEQYQKPMTRPSRPIFQVATHTDGCFTPPETDVQGDLPKPTPGAGPGAEVLEQAKQRVNDNLKRMLRSPKPLNQMELQFVARAYFVEWTVAHHQKGAVDQVTKGVDELYRRFKADPDELWKDKAVWNPEWFGVGPAGDAVRLLGKQFGAALDEKIDGEKTRQQAWSELFVAGREWLRSHQRWLANQSMFTRCNMYLSNRAVAALDPARAVPEEKALDYLYQAAGLVPFLGNETDQGVDKPFGGHFFQVTRKGLTKELGYVGGYGEVGVAGVMEMYDATRSPGGEGDAKLKAQLAKMIRARGPFRYPALDDDGRPAMRLATGAGWRDTHFPGTVLYVQPAGGEQSILSQAAATLDPTAIGWVQQMIAENQFFASVADHLKNKSFRAICGLLTLPDDYDLLKSRPPSPHRLPMTRGQPDFVFADEEDGVVAIKRGDEICYVSLYWRSRAGINGLARVQRLTPRYQQIAVVHEDVVTFEPSGKTWKRPNWTNFGFGTGGFRYPGKLDSALAGEELPIPKMPPDVPNDSRKDNPYAGKADFYQLRYGGYLIAMNTTADKTFTLTPPGDFAHAPDLVTGKPVNLTMPVSVPPRSTIVLLIPPDR